MCNCGLNVCFIVCVISMWCCVYNVCMCFIWCVKCFLFMKFVMVVCNSVGELVFMLYVICLMCLMVCFGMIVYVSCKLGNIILLNVL